MDYDVDRYAVIPQLLRERDVARSALATMDANVRQLEVESKDLETRLSEELKCRQEMLDTLASVDQRLKVSRSVHAFGERVRGTLILTLKLMRCIRKCFMVRLIRRK